MNEPKKGLTPQMRTLLASVLSIAVVIGWSLLFKPKLPPQANPPVEGTTQTSPNTAPSRPSRGGVTPPTSVSAQAKNPRSGVALAPKAAAQERAIVVENDLYRVELSNLGAVVKSWKLKKYQDDAKPPRTLDLVHPEAAQQVGGWPFSLALDDPQAEAAVNSALFVAAPDSAQLASPAEIAFEWSDGRYEVTKRFKFDHSYVVQIELSAKLDGNPIAHGIAWRGGFGDNTVFNPAERVQVIYGTGGKLQSLPYKKLSTPDKLSPGFWNTGYDYAGIEDQYFTAVFLPPTSTPGALSARHWVRYRDVQVDSKPAQEPVVEVAASGHSSIRAYVGPKDYDDLKRMNPPLHALVQFGWMEIIADPLFHILKWLHKYVPNYGWAIVVLTLAINTVLYPLRVRSYRTTQRMQKVAPEVRQIQDRYKKYSMRDPRKTEMNKEIMAVYSREGINPAGGCLPMLLQMPIWIALYRMLGSTIELRHAPWMGWIRDLSARDAYYILPVLMGLTMYMMQRMTPMPASDPAQQKMMKIMPLMFAGMFIVFPISSGLALYILTSNVVGILQQWHLNRHLPAPSSAEIQRGKNGKKK